MKKELEIIQNKFLGTLGQMSNSFGLNAFVVKLYGILYLNAKPLSLDEMAQALGASKGNVSLNIRELEKWGAAKKVWVKGSRKDYYEAELDIKKVFITKLRSSAEKRISELTVMLDEVNKLILEHENDFNNEDRLIAKRYHEQLKKVEEIKEMASHTLLLAEKIL
ncbi:MAG TPA: hypothetical protein PKL77_07760 [Candidatus Omnitrophota bacterium]|nr:hypothetical protein [Candidatus Omnitrophota bacterium]